MNFKEFARRRRALMRMMGKGSIAILPTAPATQRNRDVEYPYRPDSDFYYLTGFTEQESIAVLVPGRSEGEFLLFCRRKDPGREIWDGRRAGPAGAVAEFGADEAFSIEEIDEVLPGLVQHSERVYYTMGARPEFDSKLIGWVTEMRSRGGVGAHTPDEFIALDHLLHDLRLYKSRAELGALRKAAKIAVGAHRRAMAVCRPGIYEYELEAEYLHEFRSNAASLAYQPIVGGGKNACVLHYVQNDQPLVDGELVLADVGCEYDYYASDVTRTWPVNGRFSAAQREVYELVLEASTAATKKVQPGNHWNDPHDAAVKVITRGLIDIGLLKGVLKTLLRDSKYRKYFMHRTGHWLGMDVHDVGDYKVSDQWRLLEPGMVMTIEPGLYIGGARNIAKKWRYIGIRIEDDVAVTRDGHEVLTRALPTDPDEIERLVGTRAA
ncbi:MAG: aminopeptidase P N-terminal domain-containing protein [Gammaproteobacteria bacterium]|jgi:Xaa-Pro aminopeptidase|nr:aminopeptidase P N-terminal domain-containing protein [Gammaproteobacteria bacterium]MDP6616731.1 aminopeptidase P N-terminal domain-containing protein [Gammaproteobacteria bacterium]MDP6695204.1 aminopeptidase P N-terminal domain-containing protein [Gammaproteobacteria bacterium]MDP7041870.1 aminopeptidase P N-terminal domain-containing protein [Gammaproteobacteria bacterium]